jgi:putative peptidoglycan lipid II flippase
MSAHDDGHNQRSTQRRVAGAAGLMMVGILLSRLLGLVRERVIAHQFGQQFWTDVYNGAFTIPDLLFFLIAGGALSGAFIPVFTEYISTDREKEAWRIFSVVATVMTLVVTVFIIIGEIFTHQLVLWTNPGYSPEKVAATVALTRILLPAQICFFLGGLMMGTQTSQGRFFGQAVGPIIYNLGIILGGVLLAPHIGVKGLCYGAVAGAVIGNLALQWYLVIKGGGRYVYKGLRKHVRHPGVIQVWKLMLPVILGLALPQVSTIIGKMFASTLGDGPQSALMYANKLMQVPLGVFAQATAIAIFPTMAAQAARKEMGNLRESVNFGIRSILFMTIPASAIMIVLATPIVQLVLQSGKFQATDTAVTANVLRWFAIGIFAWSAHSVITRGFYALQDSKTPIIVGTIVTFIFIPLNWPLRAWMGVSGLALATSIAATIHMFSMLYFLRNRLRGIGGGRLVVSLTKILIATAMASAVAWLLLKKLDHPAPLAVVANAAAHAHVGRHAAIVLLVCTAAATIVYLGTAVALKMDEMRLINRLLKRKPAAAAV